MFKGNSSLSLNAAVKCVEVLSMVTHRVVNSESVWHRIESDWVIQSVRWIKPSSCLWFIWH